MAKPSLSPRDAAAVLDLADEAATGRLAAVIAGLARTGDVIGLAGALGLGKTTFARAFIRALTDVATEVPSPTFTLVQTYAGRSGEIYHFDLYRLDSPEEAWELGIEEAFANGISLIEWPERLGPLMPADGLWLSFAPLPGGGSEARRIAISGGGDWRARIGDLGVAIEDAAHA